MIASNLIGYLLGSISFSYLVGKYWAGIDIRNFGSGNAGATNTLRVLGVGPGIIVFIFDGLKGVMSVLIAEFISSGDPLVMIVAGISSIVGHNWPIYLKFKGGKGVATTIGVVASLVFWPALYSALIASILLVTTRYVSLASIVFSILIPIFVIFLGYSLSYIIFTILIAILVCLRHKENIKRLLKGTERKFGEKSR
ncbi:acyl-phosphate glycerol 3-phosphate acyltransferase [Desulfuribacillus stibiiarsenatis]|uniref:Glycerol-3-phosphate acyltransferase n=1 Tax=Desulfuribacillus stibiiarsenatis TaxID=1390249 RepID=A0A1E5L3S0_9FIRM|nr:glycerol-3-phosphate 1-O-acyltransferase PlsY [Desulfuribacillus stibiiarsenatis]OEH84782.1 acyl-phosphate glycerol 3-phosphate acyltransferase [Desulfuribacillus stibiiarsenatis]